MSAYGQVNHILMKGLSENRENETHFRFLFIISVIAHSNEYVRREMKNDYEECPSIKREMSKQFFRK